MPTSRMTIEVAEASDVGLKRLHNEDSHGVWIAPDPAVRALRGVLLVVADGMGGAQAGEVASSLAVAAVVRSYRAAPGADTLAELSQAVGEANRAVHERALEHPEWQGMGTTCTAMVLRGEECFVAHVGDSRAYLVRDGSIRRLTEDHSLVAQLVLRNQLTAEEARSDPRRNIVTRSVGVAPTVEVDALRAETKLAPGDVVVLCSDGLHGQVTDEEIAAAVRGTDLEHACQSLIALANSRGGPDNITIVIARPLAGDDGAGPPTARREA